MARLSLCLLGPLQITLDGQPVGVAYTKARALLAYLAVEAGRPHHRDTLVGLLWPELPDVAARTNLRQVLADLRQAIGDDAAMPPFLLITRDTIQLNPRSDYDLDVAAFAALLATCETHLHRRLERCRACAARIEQAIGYYRGDFLAEFVLGDSAAFEEWQLLQRERLHQRALDALVYLADYHELRGDDKQARRYTQRQIELDLWREEAHRQLMRLLARGGQRSAALAQYETCRRVLARDLDVAPASETTELAELGALLEDPARRLITIVGPGGIGKTRLALAAAAGQAQVFTHGSTFISLAAISSAAFVAPAIVAALDIPLQGQRDPREQLLTYLRGKELLLVLDNFEQLLASEPGENDGAADLLADVLRQAPGVTLLVTSRERLALDGEWLFDLPGLSYPAGEPVDGAETYGAMDLFLQRASQVRRDFALAEGEARAVARICQLVEGLPLAIELAAAALREHSCAAIAAAIETSLSALSTGLRAVPERHRNMWATFEYSWRLLSDEEQRIFPRLSVFRGGFTLEAAEDVAGWNVPTFERFNVQTTLAALVDKSLLRWDGVARYDLHELVRQYASEKLEEAGETANQHGAYFLALAERAEPALYGPQEIMWLKCLEIEHDNLRAALGWALKQADSDVALHLGATLWRFWEVHGHLGEGRMWLERAIAMYDFRLDDADQSKIAIRAQALNGAGRLAWRQCDYAPAQPHFEASLVLFREIGDRRGIATASNNLGTVRMEQGDFERGQAFYEMGLALRRELGDRRGIAASLCNLGIIALRRHEHARARTFYDESLKLFRELEDKTGIALVLGGMGRIASDQGEYARAHTCLAESLLLFCELGSEGRIAECLEEVARMATQQGQSNRAARLFGAAAVLNELLGQHMDSSEHVEQAHELAAVRTQLDDATFASAWAAGRAMSLELAVAFALANEDQIAMSATANVSSLKHLQSKKHPKKSVTR